MTKKIRNSPANGSDQERNQGDSMRSINWYAIIAAGLCALSAAISITVIYHFVRFMVAMYVVMTAGR